MNELQPRWREALDFVLARDVEHFGDRLISVLLRGSVAEGAAIDGLSDLDTAVIVSEPRDADAEYAADLEHEVVRRFPFCTGVESPLLSREELLHSPLNEGWDARAFYRLLARPVWGEDVLAALPEVPIGRATAFESPFVLLVVDEARRMLHADDDACAPASVWMFKSLVRAGYELLAPRRGTFTRELRACAAAFGEEYPGQAMLMQRAVGYVVQPPVHAEHALELAGALAPLLVAETQRHLAIDQITDRRYLARLK
jgi:predicted nucleotidyltransferase